MIIIGLHGHARAGKSTIGKYLTDKHGFVNTSFAAPLKKAVSCIFNLSDTEMKEENKEKIIHRWGLSFRNMCQLVGTEVGRRISKDIWIKNAQFFIEDIENRKKEKELKNFIKDGVVVTDVRFKNEADFIRQKNGLVIHVKKSNATGEVGIKGHESESGIPFSPSSDVLLENNGTLEELYKKVDLIIERTRLI